jgi:hopanoid biosynthesis associated RND transporter like protein HpnN
MNFIQRALRKAFVAETAHPILTLSIALILAVFAVFYTVKNLDFLTSQKQLISPKNRLIQLSETIDQVEDLDPFVVAIENQETARSLKFLHALVSVLEADHEHYTEIFFRVDPTLFKPWALLYLEKKDLLTLRDRLQEHQGFIERLAQSPSLTNFFGQINNEMASKMVGELFTGFLDEKSSKDDEKPMDLDFLIRTLQEVNTWLDGNTSIAPSWNSLFAKDDLGNESEEGYFWKENRRYLLFFVTPKRIEKSFSGGQQSLSALRKAIAEQQADFRGLKVGVTGPGALDEDEMGVALHDMTLATLLSLGGLSILLVLFWRGFRWPLMEIMVLLAALSLTFGLTTFFIGHLNILSVTFAPMLLGLGIDYGVHWLARYEEEQERRGVPKKEALEATMIKLGPGILLAGLSAALSFFPLVLTGFRGLEELGIICSMGLFVITLATLCLLPPLILLFDKELQRAAAPPSSPVRPLLRLTKGRALLLLFIGVVGLGLSLWEAEKITFDLNMLNLQSKGAESVLWEKKLIEGSKNPSMYGALIARSLEEVREKTTALKALPTVSEVQSVESLLPHDQNEKINLLREMKPFLAGIGSLQDPGDPVNLAELNEIFGRIRFKMLDSNHSQWGVSKPIETQMKQVRELIDKLRQRFRSIEASRLSHRLQTFEGALIQDLNDKLDLLRTNMNTTPMQIKDLPKPLLQRFVGKHQLYLIRVFPTKNIWEPELLGEFVRDLRSVDPDAIGDPVTLYVFTKEFRDACVKAAIYAAVLILVLLLVTLRGFIPALLAMVPLAVGTAWTVGLMHLFGVNFNLANSIFMPLVVGAGVEYGIIVVQRWGQRGADGQEATLPLSTGKGVILAGLTTTIGFGSLAISSHQGIHSLGILATAGSLCVLAAAVLFLPAILQILRNSSPNKESEQ